MKTILNLTNTQKALKEYDKLLPSLELNIDIAENTKEANDAFKLIEEAEMIVRMAFAEDTKDINLKENCKLVPIKWLRELVEKYPPSKK